MAILVDFWSILFLKYLFMVLDVTLRKPNLCFIFISTVVLLYLF